MKLFVKFCLGRKLFSENNFNVFIFLSKKIIFMNTFFGRKLFLEIFFAWLLIFVTKLYLWINFFVEKIISRKIFGSTIKYLVGYLWNVTIFPRPIKSVILIFWWEVKLNFKNYFAFAFPDFLAGFRDAEFAFTSVSNFITVLGRESNIYRFLLCHSKTHQVTGDYILVLYQIYYFSRDKFFFITRI